MVTEDNVMAPLVAEKTGHLIVSDGSRMKWMVVNIIVVSPDGLRMKKAGGVVESVRSPTHFDAVLDPFIPVKVKSRCGAILTLLCSIECSPSDVTNAIF